MRRMVVLLAVWSRGHLVAWSVGRVVTWAFGERHCEVAEAISTSERGELAARLPGYLGCGVMWGWDFLFSMNIRAAEIAHMITAPMMSEFSFCEIPIKKSPANITKKKTYAMVSIGTDFLNVAKAKITPRANWRAAHIYIR